MDSLLVVGIGTDHICFVIPRPTAKVYQNHPHYNLADDVWEICIIWVWLHNELIDFIPVKHLLLLAGWACRFYYVSHGAVRYSCIHTLLFLWSDDYIILLFTAYNTSSGTAISWVCIFIQCSFVTPKLTLIIYFQCIYASSNYVLEETGLQVNSVFTIHQLCMLIAWHTDLLWKTINGRFNY